MAFNICNLLNLNDGGENDANEVSDDAMTITLSSDSDDEIVIVEEVGMFIIIWKK